MIKSGHNSEVIYQGAPVPLDMTLQACQRLRGSRRQQELRRGRGQCRVEHRLFGDARMTDVRWNGPSVDRAMY